MAYLRYLSVAVASLSGFLFGFLFSNVYQVCHNSTFWIIVIYVDVHNDLLSFRKYVILFVYLIAYKKKCL